MPFRFVTLALSLILTGVDGFGCVPACAPASAIGRGIASRSAVRLQEDGLIQEKKVKREVDPEAMAMVDGMTGGSGEQIISQETYGLMLSTLLQTDENLQSQISANYAMVDYAFLQRLEEAMVEGKPELQERLVNIKEAVTKEMASRMQSAAEAMKDLVQSPTPVVMEGKIAALARQGRLDDALLQLLQANLEQATAAGEAGKGAVAVLSKLQSRVQEELDKKLNPEAALLRRLLRMEDVVARQALLREKMSPKKGAAGNLILDGLSKEDQDDVKNNEPDVTPRQMAEAIKEIKLRFGNVDEDYDTGFVKRLEEIGDEAEAIALDLAGGKELTARQAQDMAWEQGSVSVWDLEQIEEQAHQDGNFAVWEEEAQQQMARQEGESRKNAIEGDFSGGM